MNGTPYSNEELYGAGAQRRFAGTANQAAFLLGGIGTGNVSIGARGELRDWEIFNRPGKGVRIPYTFFAIRTREAALEPKTRVLESRLQPPFSRSHGYDSSDLAGLPRFEKSEMWAEYPFAWVELTDSTMPVSVCLEAFTPFVPLDADASGLPVAILRYNVRNQSKSPVEASIAGSLANVTGLDGCGNINHADDVVNEFRAEKGIGGLFYYCAKRGQEHPRCGTMVLATQDTNTTYKRQWLNCGWFDGAQDFWDDFCADGKLESESTYLARNVGAPGGIKIGSLAIAHTLQPGEEKTYEFILAWHFPMRAKSWNERECICGADCKPAMKNYYATLFPDAWHAATFLHDNLGRLERLSREFRRALYTSTLPAYVIDAVAANITVLRSTTCFRSEEGTFYGYEGCGDQSGCCDGTCTHVWNYAQTLAFLFPELEQTMRKVEFQLETDANGKMAFRSRTGFANDPFDFHPAADGQMGTIVRLYREWKLSGNDEMLREVWPNASRALDFAFSYWDSDGDCVLDSQQHNTYDIEFYGPNSLVNSIFYAALKAGAEIAEYLGEDEQAARYREALAKGSARMDEMLWGGEYYIQKIDNVDEYRYQYGLGCLSDQMLGQLMAHVAGLGYVLPKEHVGQAVRSIYRYNFLPAMSEHHSVQRTYALNDEPALVLCTWPHGGRPRLPFVYSDEVWTGIEYQVAAHLIYEGAIDEGLTIVKAVRDRHDGVRRNPWDEYECGHHYARAMSSWAVLTALSGFRYDMVADKIAFSPVIGGDQFSCFWSTAKGWGIYTQQKNSATGAVEGSIDVLFGAAPRLEKP